MVDNTEKKKAPMATWLIATIALVLGLAAVWFTSRRITRPLVELTDAASAIAAGDFSRQVRIARSDELGQLGNAFGAMATEVRLSREHLEQRIAERTRDLNTTLEQLHDAQDALVRRERLAMLGQLSSGVGHELRNPLGVMTNAVYFLKAVLTTAPAKVHEYLEILQQQITLSEKIVGDLLDFARQKPPQRKPTPLRQATEAQVSKLGRTDGVRVDVPSIRLKAGDKLEVRAHSKGSEYFKKLDDVSPAPSTTPEWVKVDRKKQGFEIIGLPTREDAEPDISEQLIVEYYSR